MKRREFISLLGSAVIAAPFAATAQRSTEVRRVGVLDTARALGLQIPDKLLALADEVTE